jgi:hypothetical protein
MRPAPPLALTCAPSRAWQAACALLAALAAAALAAWLAARLDGPGWPMALVSPVAAYAGGWVGARWVGPQRPASVRWDGLEWEIDGQRGMLEVMIDFDRWMLLRLRPPAASRGGAMRWLAVSRLPAVQEWHALRIALYSAAAGTGDGRGRSTGPPPGVPGPSR